MDIHRLEMTTRQGIFSSAVEISLIETLITLLKMSPNYAELYHRHRNMTYKSAHQPSCDDNNPAEL